MSSSDGSVLGLDVGALLDRVGDAGLAWQRVQFLSAQFSKYKKHMSNNAESHGPFDGYIHEYQHLALLERKDKRPLVKITKPILFKNRYLDIIPVESTNVHLGLPSMMLGAPTPGSGATLAEIEAFQAETYINANYVELWTDLMYIAAQGPLPNTVLDFWKMVWQQDTAVIVMLTNLVERGIEKCHRYWPSAHEKSAAMDARGPEADDREAALYAFDVGPFAIELLSQESASDHVLRRLRMTHIESGTVKSVLQAHYTAWPDQGTPDPDTFGRFCDIIDSQIAALKPAPLVVHCSAGVGRTGVFMACHNILQHMRLYITRGASSMPFLFDVKGTVRRMRQARPFMVQNADQYRFVYEYVRSQVDAFLSSSSVTELLATPPPNVLLEQEEEATASSTAPNHSHTATSHASSSTSSSSDSYSSMENDNTG